MDLSSPKGHSVNDGIIKEECSFHYASVDQAVAELRRSGIGALMAKMDIQRAYRNIPVAPSDRRLLGFQWQSQIYIDKALPFGLRSAPLIFSAVADAWHFLYNTNSSSNIAGFDVNQSMKIFYVLVGPILFYLFFY